MHNRTATILFVLDACRRHGEPPSGRTTLVKMSYLCELLRPAYDYWVETFKFVRYFHGPFSRDTYTAVDFLVFHGFVDAVEYSRTESAIHATYAITDAGALLAREVCAVEPRLAALADDVVWSLKTLGVRTATEICDLVYAEPHFASVLSEGEAKGIPASAAAPLLSPQNPAHPSFRLQAVFRSDTRYESPRFLVRSFLNYLAVHRPRARAGA